MDIIIPSNSVWDSFVREQGGHLLQTARWGQLKSAFGWHSHLIAVAKQGNVAAGALVLTRQLPARLGSITYVPRGPVVDWKQQRVLAPLLAAIEDYAKSSGSILLKLEPDLWDSQEAQAILAQYGYDISTQTVQPPRTVVIDIAADEETILKRMSQSTRRKVRLPYRRDITFRHGSHTDIDTFGNLIDVTGTRDDFGVHSTAYYKQAFDLFAPDDCSLILAEYENRPVAGLMIFRLGSRTWYLYGASSNEERNRMPTYGIQLEAIRWARAKNCTTYDLWGIPDESEEALEAQFQERSDGLWGVYGFKRGFGGDVRRTIGAWDKVFRPLAHRAYQTALKLRTIL